MKKLGLRKQDLMLLGVMTLIVCSINSGFAADYGGAKEIESALDKTVTWVVNVLGMFAIIGGIIFTGIRLALHDEHAIKKGGMVVAGGIMILAAKWIFGLLKGFFGS